MGADAHDADWRDVCGKKSWAADAHDAGWGGVWSQKAGQLMLMMPARVGC